MLVQIGKYQNFDIGGIRILLTIFYIDMVYFPTLYTWVHYQAYQLRLHVVNILNEHRCYRLYYLLLVFYFIDITTTVDFFIASS